MSDSHKADLYELIKSMTMSEKRYFKLFAARHTIGGKNNYVRLFDAIEKQKSYNEKKLIQTETYLSQFAVIKKNLYELILKALDAYNYGSSSERKIFNFLNSIEMLYNKGLYKQCDKIIEKAKEEISNTNRIRLMPLINNWELRLLVYRDYVSPRSNPLVFLETEIKKTYRKIAELESFTFLHANMHRKIRITGVVRDELTKQQIRSLYEKTKTYDEPGENNFLNRFYYLNIQYQYYYSNNNFAKGYSFIIKILEMFEKHPIYKRENNELFINMVFNKISMENNMYQFDKAIESVKYLKTLNAISLPLKNHVVFRTVIYELSIYCLSINFKDGYARVKQLNDFFNSQSIENINISTWFIVHYQAAFLCIGAGDYKQAIRFLNKIVARKIETESRNDLVCYSKILMLLCYYELGDTTHIEYAVKSAYRFLLKKEKLYLFEKAILKFIRRMSSLDNNQRTLSAFDDLKKELEKLLKDPYEGGAMQYFDFISWLESKLYKRPFGDLIKEKIASGYYKQ